MPFYGVHIMSQVGDSDRLEAMNLLSNIQPQHLILTSQPGGMREAF